ncbi:zf-TFIIB domain containing protein [Streptomyces sp. NRRL WC-3701]|nr:zf-TFIIB domain containing protein [Streptomyces sp. NRRL WC-3701]
MQTYNRNGVQIEQCAGCRGIFLDYGELEALSRMPPPQAYPHAPMAYPAAPAWGTAHHGHHGHHGHRGFGRMLFSS